MSKMGGSPPPPAPRPALPSAMALTHVRNSATPTLAGGSKKVPRPRGRGPRAKGIKSIGKPFGGKR